MITPQIQAELLELRELRKKYADLQYASMTSVKKEGNSRALYKKALNTISRLDTLNTNLNNKIDRLEKEATKRTSKIHFLEDTIEALDRTIATQKENIDFADKRFKLTRGSKPDSVYSVECTEIDPETLTHKPWLDGKS